ncbi:polysaccharide deacetylase family protein [Corallococcus macrosporus]|uniref:Putative oligosaccharide deacetylase n=1 Tax=Myxococcus fulvus (strain ATCC BAA-855 / HW-1) TaxID=483219 RepID=F8C8G1_MYXFH|nr:polysaccharide deacetylase family protein [Corallococcus macrosporus]AEI62007.1 putative oligosaccharide deacetylase [Corallococcus macrosporus]
MSLLTLSFDNGPDPDVTPRVLDTLASHALTAQFFVLGKHLVTEEGRRLVARARDEGHVIGNHSFTHAVPLGEDPRPDAVEAEIVATDALLAPLVPAPKWFRPFGGGGKLGPHLLSQRAVGHLRAHGYSCVLWNSVPGDWLDPKGWPEKALADCAARAHTLMVLHDIPNACLEALDGFLHRAKDLGLRFTTECPSDCVPIVEGRIVRDISGMVAAGG